MALILITAGPTREYIDDVRFLSNGSSGRMGCALAAAALADGHEATLILGPVEITPPAAAKVVSVTSALEMQAAAMAELPSCDVVIAAAAVADWRPQRRLPGKPARTGDTFVLELVPNPDIVKGLAGRKGHRVVVGFALDAATAAAEQALARARDKLQAKGLDLVVANRTSAIGSERSEAVLLFADGTATPLPPGDKSATARAIVRAAVALHEGRRRAGGRQAPAVERKGT